MRFVATLFSDRCQMKLCDRQTRTVVACMSVIVAAGIAACVEPMGPRDLAWSVTIDKGDNQTAVVGSAVAKRPAVLVKDFDGYVVPGASVSFTIVNDDGRSFH